MIESWKVREPAAEIFGEWISISKNEAALRQIECAIIAFENGYFDAAITLAGAAEGMAPEKEDGLFARMKAHPGRPIQDERRWVGRLNGTVYWLKHRTEDQGDNRFVSAFEAGFLISRAMDRWEPWSPRMQTFKDKYLSMKTTAASLLRSLGDELPESGA